MGVPAQAVESPPKPLAIGDALSLIAAHIAPLPTQEVALEQAYGRYLAQDVRAAMDLPPFASSAMDGYAVRAADTPGRLTVVGESAAGSPYEGSLAPGQGVTISTGAVLPAGADAVAPVEDTERQGATVQVRCRLTPEAFVRARGSDIERGVRLLEAGRRVGAAQVGAAAAAGLGTLPCRRRPRVAVLTTGSELRAAGQALRAGEIFDANRPMLAAALGAAGAVVEHIPAAADTREAHRAALERALAHDVVISSGGVSVGAHDLVRSVGSDLGVREVFWRVALKPGKPLAFGVRGSTLVFGLPGNPVSTLACFELFVRPALLALQGAPTARPEFGSAVLAAPVSRNPQRDELVRVRLEPGEGSAVVVALEGQQSHQIAVTAQADGLALIPSGRGELPSGAAVEYLPLGP